MLRDDLPGPLPFDGLISRKSHVSYFEPRKEDTLIYSRHLVSPPTSAVSSNSYAIAKTSARAS
jgi:hypothetical protein